MRGCSHVFVNCTPQLLLIFYNSLRLRVEISIPACLNNNNNLRLSHMDYDLREENVFFGRLLHCQII